jgi:hypothetical protein
MIAPKKDEVLIDYFSREAAKVEILFLCDFA